MSKNFLCGVIVVALAAPTLALAAVKLPYQKGQEFVVVQGYNSPPTHIKKDAYAIDFSQNGCDAYGKIAVASAAGVVEVAQENGYNGGYGTQVLVDEGNHIIARYAHMIPGTIPFVVGATVVQGQPIGAIGNTGLVAGAACSVHPGTHLHFAMYYQNVDGTFAAVSPEPISGYTDITEGRWYLSDNEIATSGASASGANLSADISAVIGAPASTTTSSSATTTVAPISISTATIATIASVASASLITATGTGTSTSLVPAVATTTAKTPVVSSSSLAGNSDGAGTNGGGGSGGVVATQSAPPSVITQSSDTTPLPVTTTPASSPPSYSISFDSSTLAIDFSWQATSSANASGLSVAATTTYAIYKVDLTNVSDTTQVATTTAASYSYPLAPGDFGIANYFVIYVLNADGSIATGTDSTIAFASTTAPAWFTTIQPVDADNSNGSWYDDNWYDLGTGFYGLIRSLTLEGSIDNSSYEASHLYLDEYLDANYTQLNQTFTISDNAPFTDAPQKITISGLSIPLQPNKYYRLRTYQDYQNRSVILAGTSATGTAMWDEYIYGTGIVRNIYSFYPYLAGVIIPNYPPFAAPNPSANVTTTFDSLNSILNFSWSPATDPDTTSSLLTYEWNISTSTLDPAGWQSVGKNFSASAPVVFGNTYTIGVRAIDDLGDIGNPLVVSWSFPAGYYPAPQQLDHSVVVGDTGGAQEIVFHATTTVSGIIFWIAANGYTYCCSNSFVSVHGDAGGSPGDVFASSSPIQLAYYDTGGPFTYGFSPTLTLSPGTYWFSVDRDPGSQDTSVAGSAGDSYPDGEWSTVPGQDAYFQIAE